MLTKSVILLACLGMVSVAQADDSAKSKQIEEKFKLADKNVDGQLTLEEAKAGMPKVAKGFDKIDVDKKGYVTVDQIKAMANAN
jgi:Ca2+-binding EF-hand superfamily protein